MKTNYLAVIVSAIVYWLLGAIWFAVLFGKQWMVLEGITDAQAKNANPAPLYVINFVLDVLLAFALAQICSWRNAGTAARGASVGVLLWIGIVAPVTYVTNMYEMKPINLFLINEGYVLLGLIVMGAILGAWTRKSA